MIAALGLLLACQLAGEMLARAAQLPFPGPVLGLILLLGILLLRRKIWPALEKATDTLLAHLSVLFVPAGVGVVQHWQQIEAHLLPLATVLGVSTLLAIVAGAGAFVLVQAWLGRKP